MNYSLTILTSWNEVDAIKKDWDRLFDANQESTIFQRFEWHASWWEAFMRQYNLHIVVAKTHAGEIVGILPLMVNHREEYEWLGSPETEYQNILFDPLKREVVNQFADYMLSLGSQYVVRLWEIPVASQLAHALKSKLQQSKTCFSIEEHSSLQAHALRINKGDIKYRINRLRKIGDITHVTHEDDQKQQHICFDHMMKWIELRFMLSLHTIAAASFPENTHSSATT